MAIRTATPSDIDSVVEIILSAFPRGHQWNYRFPYRAEHPEDHFKYTRILIQCFLDPTWDDFQVMVTEAPSMNDDAVTKIVSVSVWDVSYSNRRKHGQAYIPQNRSLTPINRYANMSRLNPCSRRSTPKIRQRHSQRCESRAQRRFHKRRQRCEREILWFSGER